MAYVLAVLASGRRRGFTAGLLAEAAEGAASVPGVEVEVVQLTRYRFDACTSCFHCIRDDAHRCSLRDDMGRRGEGALFQKVLRANGLILGDPVHGWGPSARAHVFFERLYPFTWSGELAGMPFASISCASNQGMHRLANQEICKWAFTKALRRVGGLPVHVAYYEEARAQARQLGEPKCATYPQQERGRGPEAPPPRRRRRYAGPPPASSPPASTPSAPPGVVNRRHQESSTWPSGVHVIAASYRPGATRRGTTVTMN